MEITCPSGLRMVIRKLKTKAIGSVFRNVGAGKGGRGRGINRAARLDPLLEFAHAETIDQGIYRWENGKPRSWQDVLTGDRLFVLLKAREKTFGEIYTFKTQCGSLGCRAPIKWDLDLSKLEAKMLPAASKERFIKGEPFVFDADGIEIAYHLERGRDEQRIPRDVDPITASVLSRIERVGEEKEPKKIQELVEDLDADILDELRCEMEANDCGVETSFEVICDECGIETTIELPFDRTFFMPKTGALQRSISTDNS